MLVHGLTGDCEKTWTHPRTGVFWPESLLPREFPKARIMTYGYDADIVHLLGSSSSNTLRDHGRSLAIDFASKRRRTKSVSRQNLLNCWGSEIQLSSLGGWTRTIGPSSSLRTVWEGWFASRYGNPQTHLSFFSKCSALLGERLHDG
jgi:hypothetical protein